MMALLMRIWWRYGRSIRLLLLLALCLVTLLLLQSGVSKAQEEPTATRTSQYIVPTATFQVAPPRTIDEKGCPEGGVASQDVSIEYAVACRRCLNDVEQGVDYSFPTATFVPTQTALPTLTPTETYTPSATGTPTQTPTLEYDPTLITQTPSPTATATATLPSIPTRHYSLTQPPQQRTLPPLNTTITAFPTFTPTSTHNPLLEYPILFDWQPPSSAATIDNYKPMNFDYQDYPVGSFTCPSTVLHLGPPYQGGVYYVSASIWGCGYYRGGAAGLDSIADMHIPLTSPHFVSTIQVKNMRNSTGGTWANFRIYANGIQVHHSTPAVNATTTVTINAMVSHIRILYEVRQTYSLAFVHGVTIRGEPRLLTATPQPTHSPTPRGDEYSFASLYEARNGLFGPLSEWFSPHILNEAGVYASAFDGFARSRLFGNLNQLYTHNQTALWFALDCEGGGYVNEIRASVANNKLINGGRCLTAYGILDTESFPYVRTEPRSLCSATSQDFNGMLLSQFEWYDVKAVLLIGGTSDNAVINNYVSIADVDIAYTCDFQLPATITPTPTETLVPTATVVPSMTPIGHVDCGQPDYYPTSPPLAGFTGDFQLVTTLCFRLLPYIDLGSPFNLQFAGLDVCFEMYRMPNLSFMGFIFSPSILLIFPISYLLRRFLQF